MLFAESNASPAKGVWVIAALLATLMPHANAASLRHTHRQTYPNATWIKNMFFFGDSWTDTWFDLSGVQPCVEQPLGNPPVPGDTFNSGKWPVYLTTQCNSSLVETYNFARSGSTVDASIISNGVDGPDVVAQVHGEFLPYYGAMNASSWQSSNALFGVFIGINDVNIALKIRNRTTEDTLNQVFASYAELVDELYQNGARHFLFLNMPPMDRAPGALSTLGPVIADWNRHLIRLGTNLTHSHADATVQNFDTNNFLNQVLNNPATYPETAGIKNTTGYCPAYASMTEVLTFSDASCGLSLAEYVWVNALHITFTVHQAMAAQIAKTLRW